MKKCRHPEVQQLWRWYGRWIDHLPRVRPLFRLDPPPDAEVCMTCGYWLSMGPASSPPPRTGKYT